MQKDVIRCSQGGIELLELRKPLGCHFLCPVISSGNTQRFRGKKGGKGNIAFLNPQETGILTSASTLHGGANHHGGHRHLDSRIQCGNNKRLRAAPACTGNR